MDLAIRVNGLIGYIQKTTNKRYYYVKDHLGSIRQIIHKTADYGNSNITCARDYYPYGRILRETNNAEEERFKFTEKERDQETDFDYFGARYYDSGIGRWTTADPLAALRPSLSPYNYCHNNPLNRIDPFGLIDTTYTAYFPDIVVETKDPNSEFYTFYTFGNNEIYAEHVLKDAEGKEGSLAVDFTFSTLKTMIRSILAIVPSVPDPFLINEVGRTREMTSHLVNETLETLQKKGIAKTPAVKALVFSSVIDYISKYLGPYSTIYRSGPSGDTIFYNYQQTNGLIMEVVSKHAINDSVNITLYEEFGF